MPALTLHTMVVRTRTWVDTLLLPLFLPVLGLAGCSLSDLVGESNVPVGTSAPTAIETSQGALSTYYGTLQLLNETGFNFVVVSGLFADELRPNDIPSTIGGFDGASYLVEDSRYGIEGRAENETFRMGHRDRLFSRLHRLRGNARQSRGALLIYAPNVSRAIVGHTYAIEGFAEVMLADLYCSGIPLSTVDYGGDFTLKPGSTTQEVYRHAIVLFDSALALSEDSLQVKDFARMGKARALMALGDYAGAQQASVEVATVFKYALASTSHLIYQDGDVPLDFGWNITDTTQGYRGYSISDGEGVTSIRGIPYGSRNDPRARMRQRRSPGVLTPYPVYVTTKYDSTGRSPIVIASGIEARLIQAEAELAQGSSNWLVTLNALRTTCTSAAACPSPAPAGSGKVAGLSPLSDPGNAKDRVALLFEERAFWLFLTGHRQGDMRRLVREHGWEVDEVYPTGQYYRRSAAGVYEQYTNWPTPPSELPNPEYNGCFHRRA